ncbi:MAG: ferredoxin-thioredoxin reductase catalytic domain-containing protein [Thermodesulfovibrionales bacterium]
MSVEKLYEVLKEAQERKGYQFNRDRDAVIELLRGLLVNAQRYGYMSCPCRLASGDYSRDRDIICPCEYRERDIEEFGSCYCNLYVSSDWNEGSVEQVYVPERRPAERMAF